MFVCSEGLVTYHPLGDGSPVSVRIPRRRAGCGQGAEGALVVAHVMHKHKKLMFFLLQTEYGDLFKLTMEVEDDEVKQVRLFRLSFSLSSCFHSPH